MKLIHKRILYSTAFLIFFLIGPVLLMFSAGYRFNLLNFTLYKTGLLYIDSEPSSITFRIGEKEIQESTPIRLTNLIPGLFSLEAKKDGYLPWKKEVEIFPGKTTFFKEILLLPEINFQEIDTEVEKIYPNQQNELLLYTKENSLYEFNINKNTHTIIENGIQSSERWINTINSSYLYKDTNGDFHLLENTILKSDFNLQKYLEDLNINPEKIRWASENTLSIFDIKKKQYFLTLSSVFPKKIELIDSNIQPENFYFKSENSIYRIVSEEQKTYLQRYEAANEWKTLFQILSSTHFIYKYEVSGNLIHLLDTDNNIYYQLNPETQEAKIYQNITNILVNKKESPHLINEHEIHLFWNGNYSLAYRSAQKLLQAESIYYDAYLLVLDENKNLSVIEVNTYGNRNIYLIANNVESFFLNQEKDIITFLQNKTLKTYTLIK